MYADHAATALPVLYPVATDRSWGNPAASHGVGRAARAAADAARVRIARALGLPADGSDPARRCTHSDALRPQLVVATSGGTESDNLIVRQPFPGSRRAPAVGSRPRWRFIITAATEHHAVTHPAEYMSTAYGRDLFYLHLDGVDRGTHPGLERAAVAPPAASLNRRAAPFA